MTPDAVAAALEDLRQAVESLRSELALLRQPSPGVTTVDLLTAEDVARLIGVGERTLRRERKSRAFPKPVRGRGRPRWRRRDIERWLEGGR